MQLESDAFFFPLIFTFLPLSPNTSVSFPADGAVNLMLVDDSILRHCVSVSPLYVTVPLFDARLPEITKNELFASDVVKLCTLESPVGTSGVSVPPIEPFFGIDAVSSAPHTVQE